MALVKAHYLTFAAGKLKYFVKHFWPKLPTIFFLKFIVEFDTEYINELVAVFEDYQIIANYYHIDGNNHCHKDNLLVPVLLG